MIYICENCGKEFKSYCGKRSKHHYCSRECFSEKRDTRIKATCSWCGKEILIHKSDKENRFCCVDCANSWQRRNQVSFVCKQCGKTFYRSPSWAKQKCGYYCSMKCRNDSDEWRFNSIYKANQVQCRKKGLNKLELKGNKILDRLAIEYETQYLISNKFCVDVYIPKYNLIIQWDGNYWHGKGKKYEDLDPRVKKRVDLDKSQNSYFKKSGYAVLRFWEDEVVEEEDRVYADIKRTIDEITKRNA